MYSLCSDFFSTKNVTENFCNPFVNSLDLLLKNAGMQSKAQSKSSHMHEPFTMNEQFESLTVLPYIHN